MGVELVLRCRADDDRGDVLAEALVRNPDHRDLPDGRMRGTVTTYQWTSGRWVRQARSVVDPLSREGRWVGWHVKGLARY